MPPDNSATVAPGTNVAFPENGSSNGIISRLGSNSFQLTNIGTYEIFWQVSIDEPGQLVLTLNNVEVASTLAGRATGTSQIVNDVFLTTTVVNSVLTVRNPAGESTALTITPLAGGANPVSASLAVKQID
jgi:hypothetical protein